MASKITTARFYADHILSKVPGLRDSIVEGAAGGFTTMEKAIIGVGAAAAGLTAAAGFGVLKAKLPSFIKVGISWPRMVHVCSFWFGEVALWSTMTSYLIA